MTRIRWITELGMGVDLHGKDATKAAKRAALAKTVIVSAMR